MLRDDFPHSSGEARRADRRIRRSRRRRGAARGAAAGRFVGMGRQLRAPV